MTIHIWHWRKTAKVQHSYHRTAKIPGAVKILETCNYLEVFSRLLLIDFFTHGSILLPVQVWLMAHSKSWWQYFVWYSTEERYILTWYRLLITYLLYKQLIIFHFLADTFPVLKKICKVQYSILKEVKMSDILTIYLYIYLLNAVWILQWVC